MSRAPALRGSDAAASTIVGALVVLAVLGLALVYVNAYHVPRQGAALEVEGREEAESSLADLAARLAAPQDAPVLETLPLRPPPARPPLLAGVVLSPTRAEGRLALEPDGTTLRASVVVPAPPTGVPANDPIRVAAGAGLMRVYLVGNATAGQPLGALALTSGGAYLDDVTYRLEGGLVLAARPQGSVLVVGPPLDVRRDAGLTSVSWRVPFLAGEADAVSGLAAAQVHLAPGPEASAGGGQPVRGLTVEVTTRAASAWRSALQEAVGAHGTVGVASTGADAGTVTAVVLPPPGTPADVSAVRVDVKAVRFVASLGERY